MSRYPDESILVVSRALFDELGAFQGLCTDPQRYLPALLDPENNYFLARDDAEDDPAHKQIIPYAIFRHGDRFLHYVRGGGGGEKRLAAKGSIGIGGHINAEDYHASDHLDKDTYSIGVEREISEELRISGSHTQRVVALLNDDSNEVGKVHLGVVHIFRLESDAARKREAVITESGFLTIPELRARRDALETWSQLCLDGLDRLLAAAR